MYKHRFEVDCNKPETCILLSVYLEGVKLHGIITESKLTNNILSKQEGINKITEIIKEIELGMTSILSTMESKLFTIESKMFATALE